MLKAIWIEPNQIESSSQLRENKAVYIFTYHGQVSEIPEDYELIQFK